MSRSVYYCRFTGDYARDTSHLTLIQHGAYTVLLDFYYSSGKPLPPDMNALCRICRAFEDTERDAVSQIVSAFFELRADGYHNKRADAEISYRAEQHERLSKGAKKTNEKRWGSVSPSESPSDSQSGRIPSPSPTKKKKEKTIAAKTRPTDPRFQPFLDSAYRAFQSKYLQAPTWGDKHFNGLKQFLRRAPQVALAEWERRYLFFLASTKDYYREQHGSIAIFCSQFDSFADGPILAGKGGNNGKPSLSDSAAVTIQSHVEREGLPN